ncbi:MAG: hypothetical protein V3V25_06960 [Paracoccaceae bacterium]
MVIIFLASGTVFGAAAASLALMSGGSVLMALLSYSFIGTTTALLLAYGMFLLSEANNNSNTWGDGQENDEAVSA